MSKIISLKNGSGSNDKSLQVINQHLDDEDYVYYLRICNHLLIKPFAYEYFQYNKDILIGKHRHRWLYDINPLYGEWHTNHFNLINDESGYTYSTGFKTQSPELLEGLKLLEYTDKQDYDKSKGIFRKLILNNHPDKVEKANKTKAIFIITAISTAMDYIRFDSEK